MDKLCVIRNMVQFQEEYYYVYPTQMVFSPYPASSKQMTRSLQYLETILAEKPSLG